MNYKTFGTALAAAVLLASAGNAAITVTASSGPALPAGFHTVVDFDHPDAPGYAWTWAPLLGYGSVSGTNTAPAGLPANNFYGFVSYSPPHYTADLAISTPTQALSVYIGSLDTYNEIKFFSGNTVVGDFTGSDLSGLIPGLTADGVSSGTFAFNFHGLAVDKVEFHTGWNSFEFDNIAAGVVPEPAIWAMLLTGFGLAGAFLRNRPKMVTA